MLSYLNFAFKDTELGQTDTVKMRIDTGDNPPVKLTPCRTPLHKREIVDKAITDMLKANIIRRSNSNYSSPVILMDKKDKTTRFCIDFKNLNSNTLSIRYPLPVIDDILTLLGAAKFYSLIDLRSGFWQVQIADEDKSKTAFVCHRGLFEFNVMPFGCSNKKYAKFQWDEECQKDFDFLKYSLTVTPLLAYPDLKKPYVLYTDASNDTIGACFTQPCEEEETHLPCLRREKPIIFLSHKLSDTQSRWSTIEKEAFSIHYALQKLDHYLHGAEFIIRTDHKPLKKSKLDTKWKPYYRIIEKTSPVTFVLKNQLDGSVARKVHLEHFKKVKIDEWVIPTNIEGRQLRKTNYVVLPEDSDGSESELPDANPRERLINRYRQERETSSDKDNIPLADLKQKLGNKKRREKRAKRSSLTSGSNGMSDNNSSDGYNSESSQNMSVGKIIIPMKNKRKVNKSEKKDELMLKFLSNISCDLNKMHD
ncbi:unnamed protein product [Mytilus coruscus]|uniref:Uncharacterized protein n=1 Tax=Mytilus coruscus TaxID=42192 RepID=A0A6J8B0Q3_MYTCO|nr:unnamed protein product [Mytilus coruscus]